MNNVPKQSEKNNNTPAIGTPMGAVTANTKYTEHGLPDDMAKKGSEMTENDYYKLRKVL